MAESSTINQLRKWGYKPTRQRKAIIEVLMDNRRPLTVQELYSQVKKKMPSISQDTVYRNMEVLAQINAVNRIRVRGGDRFELDNIHHHHFICLECGEVSCLEGCPIGPKQLAQARDHGFKVTHHRFELSGYCTRCQGEK